MVSLVSSATRLQISTELVIKEERAHVEWKPSQWSCCWVGRDVSQVKLSKFTVHVLHCLPEFVHSLLIDMVLCLTQYNILLSLYFESWMNGYEENLLRLRVSLYWGQSLLNLHSFLMLVVSWLLSWWWWRRWQVVEWIEVARITVVVKRSSDPGITRMRRFLLITG